jgi:hypothetical protein
MTQMTIRAKERMRSMLAGSPKNTTSIENVPKAPIPVQTAYAVPYGDRRCAIQRKKPLSAIKIAANTINSIRKPVVCDNLNPTGQPISNSPAMMR